MATYGPSQEDIKALEVKRQADLARLSPDERRSREYDIAQGHVGSAEEDLAKLAADIVESWQSYYEGALGDLGVFTPDMDAIKEQAIALIMPYFDQQLTEINREIDEGQLQTVEDYNYRINNITDGAIQALKPIAITESQTEEELLTKLDDIGARKEYELAKTETASERQRRAEEANYIKAGKGWSGSMKEEMSRIAGEKALEIGEVSRQAGRDTQAAQTSAKYTKEKAQAAREEIISTQQRETARATELGQRGMRQYGYEEGMPEVLNPGVGTPQYGIYGAQKMGEWERNKYEAELAQINELTAEQQQQFDLASAKVAEGIMPMDTYFGKEYALKKLKL